MTFEEYIAEVARYSREYASIRAGQAFFNCIPAQVAVNFANLDQTYRMWIDPFHNNEAIPRFLAWAVKNWEEA